MKKPHKAFTLLEVLLVGAVLALIAGVSVFSLVAFARAAMLDAATDSVVEFATEARGNSIVMQEGRIWGIKVQAPPNQRPFVALFSCITEASCADPDQSEELKRYTFPSTVALEKPKPPSALLLIFAARSGELKDESAQYIILSAGQLQRTAVVNEPGMIEVFPQTSAKKIEATIPGGYYPDVAIGQDGFPIFSHSEAGELFVTKCNDPDCAQHSTTTVQGVRVAEPRIGISASGRPFLVFFDIDARTLGLIRCIDSNCAVTDEKQNPDPDRLAFQISLTINPEGLPVIVYAGTHKETSERALRFARCLNAPCTQTAVRTLASDSEGGGTSVVIAQNGFPLIAYSASGGGLTVIACDDSDCDPNVGGPDPRYRPDPPSSTTHIAMVVNQNGLPVIAFASPSLGEVRVVTCAAPDCSATASAFTILADMSSNDTGWGLDLTIGSDNLPGIVYSQVPSGIGNAPRFLNTAFAGGGGGGPGWYFAVAFAKCSNPNCSGVPNIQQLVISQEPDIIPHVTSVIQSNSNPVIGYRNPKSGPSLLGIFVCKNPLCS